MIYNVANVGKVLRRGLLASLLVLEAVLSLVFSSLVYLLARPPDVTSRMVFLPWRDVLIPVTLTFVVNLFLGLIGWTVVRLVTSEQTSTKIVLYLPIVLGAALPGTLAIILNSILWLAMVL